MISQPFYNSDKHLNYLKISNNNFNIMLDSSYVTNNQLRHHFLNGFCNQFLKFMATSNVIWLLGYNFNL